MRPFPLGGGGWARGRAVGDSGEGGQPRPMGGRTGVIVLGGARRRLRAEKKNLHVCLIYT